MSNVDHPAHYGGEDWTYEAIKVIEAYGLDFHLGNAVKYILRAGKKGIAREDLEKAVWYLNRKLSLMEPPEVLKENPNNPFNVYTTPVYTGAPQPLSCVQVEYLGEATVGAVARRAAELAELTHPEDYTLTTSIGGGPGLPRDSLMPLTARIGKVSLYLKYSPIGVED